MEMEIGTGRGPIARLPWKLLVAEGSIMGIAVGDGPANEDLVLSS